jgi:hypothetical protein
MTTTHLIVDQTLSSKHFVVVVEVIKVKSKRPLLEYRIHWFASLVNNNFHDFLWVLFQTLRRILASIPIRSHSSKRSFYGIPSPVFFQQVKGLVVATKFDAISCRRGLFSVFLQRRLGQSTQLQVLVRQELFT